VEEYTVTLMEQSVEKDLVIAVNTEWNKPLALIDE